MRLVGASRRGLFKMGKIKMINGIIKLVINKDLFVILRLYVLEK